MTKYRLASTASAWLNPASEKLLTKFMELEEKLPGIEAQQLDPEQQKFVETCKTYLKEAENLLECRTKFHFFESRHPHLVWELLHRVDENLILLIKKAELQSTAIDVRNSFDLNIKEEKTRGRWIGDNGKLNEAIEHIEKGKDSIEDRYALKDAQNLVNEQVDRTFWQLSENTRTSVWSGALLAILVFLAWLFSPPEALISLDKTGLSQNFSTLFILGLMGAYLSNLMTNTDFLYLRGGPYWRYFLLNLFAKPVMSGFAAIFIYLLAKTELIFSIGSAGPGSAASKIIYINVSKDFLGYAYAILAIISGFSADKILKSMIDNVLKKLEQKAEKTKDSGKDGT